MAGVKNFLGNTKLFVSNLIIGAGEKGICCYQSDGSANIGRSNHLFQNNTCIYAAGTLGCGNQTQSGPYKSHCPATTVNPGTNEFRTWIQNSSFATANNTYLSTDSFHLRCPPSLLSLKQTQAMTGEELGSTQGSPLQLDAMVSLARALLRMGPAL